MENVIYVDFSLRRGRSQTHSRQQLEGSSSNLLEEVVDTYLLWNPNLRRDEARTMIRQGLMFQQSLLNVEEAL